MDSLSFKTRARTIDHLGREQIADCPTAISELWKNSYDAYATEVGLHIFDGEVPIAALVDDGHGMSRGEFEEKWLVIGTESKADSSEVPEKDRRGLPYRPRQGQKGIGRLSSAALGPLLLIVSKRKGEPFVAAMIDWRLFENPFLYLEDIEIPVVDFAHKTELFELLPSMFDRLMGNIWGDGIDTVRDDRIASAWKSFDSIEANTAFASQDGKIALALQERNEPENPDNQTVVPRIDSSSLEQSLSGKYLTPVRDFGLTHPPENKHLQTTHQNRALTRHAIEQVIIGTNFNHRQIEQWPVWTNRAESGTALLIGDIAFDLESLIPNRVSPEDSSAAEQARSRLFGTLSNFTDPFVDPSEEKEGYSAHDFKYSVTAWEGALNRVVISTDHQFDYYQLESLEHVVDGRVDDFGIFRGRVKAFGEWIDEEVTIVPKVGIPARADSKIGPFHLRIGTYERAMKSTSHTPEVFAKLGEQAERYAGFMVYRNGLRVMPYGREDNDFFEIEKRRTQHAGREFWANRRIFGRVGITRELNPNLKDKAGREGIIDNKAAKVFRDVVENILMTTARRYFGTDAEVRKQILPEIQKDRAREKAEEAQKKIRSLKRKEFSKSLLNNSPQVDYLLDKARNYAELARKDALPQSEIELIQLRDHLSALNNELRDLSLGPPPNNLGSMEELYNEYRNKTLQTKETLAQLNDAVVRNMVALKPKSPRDIAYSELNRNASFLHNHLRKWIQEAREILLSESRRLSKLVEERNKSYHLEMLPMLEDLECNRISMSDALNNLEKEREKQERDNSEFFKPYISTLKNLQENVDIETLVDYTMDESREIRQELERLHALAQLGITVEIIGHEIEGLETTMTRGLLDLPPEVKSLPAFNSITAAHESLTDRLRFLSPLKLSGEKIKIWITGEMIYKYVLKFFGDRFINSGIVFEATESFLTFKIYEQIARIHPVFINLVNNAIYWVGLSKENIKTIILDVVDGKVVVADNGPGVETEDVSHLFSLFFTRKMRGGRGVGLYLCRANLAAGGHTINYVTDRSRKRLSGANFMINFKGPTNV